MKLTHCKYGLMLLLVSLLTLPLYATAPAVPGGFAMVKGCPFIICSDGNDTTQLRMTDSEFNRLAVGITFRVNRTEVNPNQPFFSQVNDSIVRALRSNGYRIEKIFIRGGASPEGPFENNRFLGIARTRQLRKVVNTIFGNTMTDMPEVASTSIIEDYRYLVDLMWDADDPDVLEVNDLMDRAGWDEERCKIALQQLRGGEVWNRLYKTYYPTLRSARMVIWVKSTPDSIRTIVQDPMPLELEPIVFPIPDIADRDSRRRMAVEDWRLTGAVPDTTQVTPQDTVSVDTVPEAPKDTVLPTPQDSVAPSERINRREMLSIKTNLILDLAYVHKYGMAWILNAQVEYYPKHGHITPVLSFDGPWWQNRAAEHKYFQVRNYQAEARWYFRKEDARYDGWYAGIYGHGMLFGVGFNGGEGYQGEGWGVGLSGGYVLPLIKKYKHLKLEFGIQVGYFRTKYDPYVYGCPVEQVEDGLYYYNWTGKKDDFVPRQWLWQWFGPTRVGITITYDLLYRKHSDKNRPMDDDYNKDIKGASFIWHE